MANGNDNQVDSLKLGIEIGGLDNSQIKNLKDLNNTLGNLDKILTSDFVKRLEVLSNIKINVDTNQLGKLNKDIRETTTNVGKAQEMLKEGKTSIDLKSKVGQEMGQLKARLDFLKQLQRPDPEFRGGNISGQHDEITKQIIDTENKLEEIQARIAEQKTAQKASAEAQKVVQISGEALQNVVTNTYGYINGELINIKQKIEGQLETITIETKEKTKKYQDIIDSSFKETGKSAKESADVFLKEGVIDNPWAFLEDERWKTGSQWDDFRKKQLEEEKKQEAIKKEIAKATKQEAKDTQKTTKEQKKSSGFGKFTKTLGRIALYRAIRAILKTIVKTIREGARAFAQFSPQFNETMTLLISSGKNLAMSFTSAFAPIIQSVTPFIVNLANTITNINNKIAEAISYMKGIGTYTKVNTEYQEEYNKAVNKLSFDKFDVLQQEGYGGFEEVAVDTEKMAENASIFESIKTVVETFKTMLSSVREPLNTLWEVIKGFATEYGDEILYIVNQVIYLFKEVIKQISLIFTGIKNFISLDIIKSPVYIGLGGLKLILEAIKGVIKTITTLLDALLNWNWEGLGDKLKNIWKSLDFGSGLSTSSKGWDLFVDFLSPLAKTKRYATGGVPDSGSLFLAGEAGAELVGTMSGGRTGVMNMEQMENAVKKGMIEAYSLFANRRTESSETINVNISDETLFTAVRKTAKRRGFDFANV